MLDKNNYCVIENNNIFVSDEMKYKYFVLLVLLVVPTQIIGISFLYLTVPIIMTYTFNPCPWLLINLKHRVKYFILISNTNKPNNFHAKEY